MPFFCCAHSCAVHFFLYLPSFFLVHSASSLNILLPIPFMLSFIQATHQSSDEVWSPCVQVRKKASRKNSTTLLWMCVACKVPRGFLNTTLHSITNISRKRVSCRFSPGTVYLQEADCVVTVHRQCMQSHRSS